jgi:hypothetical protein
VWSYSPAGTAGAVATPAQMMRLDVVGNITSTGGLLALSAGVYPAYNAAPSFTIYNSANHNYLQFQTGWYFDWDVSNGNLNWFGNGRSLFNFAVDGTFSATAVYASSSVSSGYIHSTGGFMADAGTFYVANNTAYYLGRSSADGAWRFVDNNIAIFTIDSTGGANSRGNFVAGGSLFATAGVYSGLAADFGMFSGGTGRVMQFAGNWYWDWNITNGQINWVGGGLYILTLRGDGTLIMNYAQAFKPGGGAWADVSDARIKTVAGVYPLGLDEIMQLNPIYYRFNGNDAGPKDAGQPGHTNTEKLHIGLVAQEVELLFPEMVQRESGFIDGKEVDDMRILDLTSLPLACVNAIKQLAMRVTALEGRIN